MKNPISFHINTEDFLPASKEERQSLVVMRESVSFWQDGFRRLFRNKVAMVSAVVLLLIIVFSFVIPAFYPYRYEQQRKGAEYMAPMRYSQEEHDAIAAGERVFPHILGTDSLGRDYAVRVMVGGRISLIVGIVASAIIFFIGSIYGAVSAFFGGRTDNIMMRIVDIIYTIPDILMIVLIAFALKAPMQELAKKASFAWLNAMGVNLISIFIVFALLYWVGMARIVRSQVLSLKETDFVMAARALGASNGRIIRKHLLTNCIGTLIITTTLQIPISIFTESFLSFLGLGVAAPMPSLGSLASSAINGINSYPYLALSPALLIALIILSFNLLGDGLRDSFDPKLKQG
ncbi:MAG: ABC transporter permease [Oscillospiraceae bacterium]|nr:ABC transporter permease [Oscillospiraceae bacterium]